MKNKTKTIFAKLLLLMMILLLSGFVFRGVVSHYNYAQNKQAEIVFKDTLQNDFINNQSTTDVFKVGVNSSNANGCGWISIYNANKILNLDIAIADIIKELDVWGLNFYGLLGINPFAIKNFYQKRGYKTELTLKSDKFEQKIMQSKVSIIAYVSFSGGHYQTVTMHNEELIKLYNPQKILSMEDYLQNHKNHAKFLITIN